MFLKAHGLRPVGFPPAQPAGLLFLFAKRVIVRFVVFAVVEQSPFGNKHHILFAVVYPASGFAVGPKANVARADFPIIVIQNRVSPGSKV